jgi:hypothetical protein
VILVSIFRLLSFLPSRDTAVVQLTPVFSFRVLFLPGITASRRVGRLLSKLKGTAALSSCHGTLVGAINTVGVVHQCFALLEADASPRALWIR